jgi:hypothetical protein
VKPRAKKPVAERFWSKVDRNGPTQPHCPELGNCWVWTAGTTSGRYGKFRLPHGHVAAHRMAWELERGPIADGLWVLHRCDNIKCVRPSHLFLGTPVDNVNDRDRKGRGAKGRRISDAMPPEHGELNPAAKLTEIQVLEIRAAQGRQVDIASRYGIDQTTVSRIKLRKGWRHVA